MPRNTFHKRASALEDEFFHRIDQKLVERLRQQHDREVDENALTIATGIADRSLLDELISLEITSKSLIAFSLFPAIYVAWADGHVETAERKAVLKSATQLGVISESAAYQLLQSWLRTKPSPELFRAWVDFIHALRPTLSPKAFRELHEGVIGRSRKVAGAAGGIFGIHKVAKSEHAAIEKLHTVFADANAECPMSAAAVPKVDQCSTNMDH
jgi:hypothetical protein